MKPIDFRNENFESLKERLCGERSDVWHAWLAHGPGTTRDVAARARLDILNFRPRTTELFALGAVCLADTQDVSGAGVYRARTFFEWQAWARVEREKLSSAQQQLL